MCVHVCAHVAECLYLGKVGMRREGRGPWLGAEMILAAPKSEYICGHLHYSKTELWEPHFALCSSLLFPKSHFLSQMPRCEFV